MRQGTRSILQPLEAVSWKLDDMSKLLRVLPAVVLAPLLASCVTIHAKTASAPPLDVPPPPPHVVPPAPELPSMPEPVGELPPPAAGQPTHTAKPPAPKTEPKAGETKPPEAKPPEPTPVEQPKEAPKSPEPAPQLSTPQTADTSTAVNGVRATIDRAQGLLNSVDYRHLSNERKKAYNDAKQFLAQAEKGLQQNNLQFAQGVATKAEMLAHELAGR